MKTIKSLILFGMFATLFKLFGCSAQTDKKKVMLNDSLMEQIQMSIENFNNRPIYKELTIDIINKTPDNELLQTIFDNLTEKLPADYNKEYETVLTFSNSRQAIFVIWYLEAEVNNGGFNQYYFNTSGQFAKLTPDALKLIGANKYANLVSKANQLYESENKQITKDQDGTLEGFSKSYKNNPLNELDSEFYTLYKTEDLQKLQIDYIRKHSAEFIDK